MERRQEETNLVLEVIQIRDGAVGEIRCLKQEAFGHISPSPRVIEDQEVANYKSVG